MSVVKEYLNDKTKIRIHSDYITYDENKNTKELIISLMINYLNNKHI